MANPQTPSWQPAIDLSMLQLRAQLLARIRTFFADRQVLEVETPVLSHAGNPDPYIDSFSCHAADGNNRQRLFLHTSPEFAMKRLLAAGSGSIYQICKVFRREEQGSLHNPEFTMLEWYRSGFDHQQLMDEIQALLVALDLHEQGTAIRRLSYRQWFLDYAGLDPFAVDQAQLLDYVRMQQISLHADPDQDLAQQPWLKDDYLALIQTHIIEPKMSDADLLFVYDFPASQASLARIRDDDPNVAERFELYAGGIELANGFNELTDAHEQHQRFLQEQAQRERKGLNKVPFDQYVIDALTAGMEACAGVALGFDRLLMLAAKKSSIQEVMPFPFERV